MAINTSQWHLLSDPIVISMVQLSEMPVYCPRMVSMIPFPNTGNSQNENNSLAP